MKPFKMFRRLQLLWKEPEADGITVERSEIRLRTLLLGAAMVLGPPLIFLLYMRIMFPGLIHKDALDFAQLGRNLGVGHGYVTHILKPLALTHGSNPLHQPEMVKGPLFPFTLAIAFGAFGAKDSIAALVSGLFYMLTVPVLYRLALKMFNRAIALLTAAIFAFNALILEYAASGLHITLYIFLTTSLFLVVYELSVSEGARARQGGAKMPRNLLFLAGALTGLLYLTDSLFVWFIPVLLGAVLWQRPAQKGGVMVWFGMPLALLVLPWMVRNHALTGNAIFGLRGFELWMNTKGFYPETLGYRMSRADIIPSMGLFKAVVQKILLGAGTVIQNFPQVTASWVLAFFLPSLLFRFTNGAANVLRSVMMLCFMSVFLGMMIFQVEMPVFVAIIPTMLVYSVAYLMHLAEHAQLNRLARALVTALIGLAVLYPLLSDMTLIDKLTPLKEAKLARQLGAAVKPDEVVISDQPWIVAWYTDRPVIWVPAVDGRIEELRTKFPKIRWLFITEEARQYNDEWRFLYDVMWQWTKLYAEARNANRPVPTTVRVQGRPEPLFVALQGFTSVPPPTGSLPSAVVATLPEQTAEAPSN